MTSCREDKKIIHLYPQPRESIVMKCAILIFLSTCCYSFGVAQNRQDSGYSGFTDTLEPVTFRAFEQKRVNGPVQVLFMRNSEADRGNKLSLVSGFNTLPGVRMEERSPGSYRLNIRGSSLRSPFGVRNVKVYWNDLPVTDPGGNTYFNQFAANSFSTIEVVKGPAGSLYGAGTGGLILMHSLDDWQPGVSAEYMTGSYGLQSIFGNVQFGADRNRNIITFANNKSNGYRIQTAMQRTNFSWVSEAEVSKRNRLTASILYNDMEYQTPGPLTATEYAANPQAARPAGGGFPGAVAAKATIYQKNLLAGFSNHYQLSSSFSNTTALFGSFAQIKNPAIRNYERRQEPHFGGRSFFTWRREQKNAKLQLITGGELQEGFFNTQVFQNRQGNPDTLQTDDDIRYSTYSLFAQVDADFNNSWMINAGVSLNQTKVAITRLNRYPVVTRGRTYKSEYAPRISVLKNITKNFALIATVSKGFSPPTVSELLPSTTVISTDLEAESGINYELTARTHALKRALRLEFTAFYFKLNNALVQRRDQSGADYYINAGDTKQKGFEFSGDYNKYFSGNRLLRSVIFRAAYSYHDFEYGTLAKDTVSFRGKRLPGVPQHTVSVAADLNLTAGAYINLTWFTASKTFLNDANNAVADGYKLLGARIGWRITLKKFSANIYGGADNLLDEKYSLGNDINDPRGRFYNAASGRNFYAGISVSRKGAKN